MLQGPTDAYGNIVADERMVKQAGKLQALTLLALLVQKYKH